MINIWIIFHLFIGLIFAYIVPGKLEDISSTILLPLLGILIGLSFAWAGNVQALMQSSEIEELSKELRTSKSKVIREAIKDLYLKEKRARENLLFFVDLYNKGVITKDIIFLLLPREDADAVIIGSKTGEEAAEIVREFNN